MDKYIPKMYKKSIHDIDYDKLKNLNIKCLMFDLDNTLLKVNKNIPKKEICDLIHRLKANFSIFIVTNNGSSKRVSAAADRLGVNYVKFSMKPFSRGFRAIKNKYNFTKDEMCIIGDQLMTDICGGNKYGIYTILVDPLAKEELAVTGINRFLEKRKLKKLSKKGLLKRGEYYE